MNTGKKQSARRPAQHAPSDILDLLARCLDDQDPHYEKAWSVLFKRVKTALKAQNERSRIAEEVLSHLQDNGSQALRSLYSSLSSKVVAREITTSPAQSRWFSNTVRKVAKNLLIDQDRKKRIPPGEGPSDADLPEYIYDAVVPRGPTRRRGSHILSLDTPVGDTDARLSDYISHEKLSERDISHRQLREQQELKSPSRRAVYTETTRREEASVHKTLLILPPNLRLAFVLKSKMLYDYFGLDDECVAYLAERSGLSPDAVSACIREEYAQNIDEREDRTAVYPFSSRFIASLANTTADAVDQWQSRARRKLQAQRSQPSRQCRAQSCNL